MLFLDLVGFSRLARHLETEQLRDLADAVLTTETHIISEYDGRVDTLVGDGLLAVFGAPNSHPDDAQRAVLAAAASLQAIRSTGANYGLSLQGRAGVNTGIAIAGMMGTGEAGRYTVMGDVVNLAAKLEKAADPGQLYVGEETYARTRRAFQYEVVGPVSTRGSVAIDQAYRLVLTPPRRALDPYRSLPMVGRDGEMAALGEALRRVRSTGSPGEVWLVGAAGSGKSRLLDAFVAASEAQVRAIAIEVRPGVPYSWKELEEPVFGAPQAPGGPARRDEIARAVEALLPDEPRWQHVILASLELAESKRWTRLDRRSVNRANLAWRDLLAAIARGQHARGALIVAVDGVPNDPMLLEFLAVLRQAQAPILILRTSRVPVNAPDAEVLELPPLSWEQSLSLLDRIASPALRPVSEALVPQVSGLPAYALELGRVLSNADAGSLPQSVASLLQSHLDTLEADARILFAHAALAGNEVWRGLLLLLEPSGNPELVRVLVERDLLVPRASSAIDGEIEYCFQSSLLRRAAEQMVPYRDRPLIHLHIATWLEEHAPPAFAALIATHFHAGGSPDAAMDHYLDAAQREGEAGNVRHASDLYETALGLDAGDDLLAKASLCYAQLAVTIGDRDLALRQLDRARTWLAASASSDGQDLSALAANLRRSIEAMN